MILLVRAATVVAGFVLLAVSMLLFFLPETAVGLAIYALGLLGREFAWARDGQAELMVWAAQMRDWFVRQPIWARFGVSILLAAVLLGIIVLIFGR